MEVEVPAKRRARFSLLTLILLTTIAFVLVGGTVVLMTVRPAAACATWHCGCQDHEGAIACRG